MSEGGLSESDKQELKSIVPEKVPQEELKLDPAKVTNQKVATVAQTPHEEGEGGSGEEEGGEEKGEDQEDAGVKSELPETVPKDELHADPASVSKNKFKPGTGAE